MAKEPPGKAPAPGKKPPKKPSSTDADLQKFLDAEAQQESGGNWGAISPDGALGKWQVMPENLGGWARQCHLKVLTPDEFLANHGYQYALVKCILGGYFTRYGPAGAAAMWYSGQSNPGATFGNPPVYVYVQDVMAIYYSKGGPRGPSGAAPPGGAPGLQPIPKPGNDSWSDSVSVTAQHMGSIHTKMSGHSGRIKQIVAAKEAH